MGIGLGLTTLKNILTMSESIMFIFGRKVIWLNHLSKTYILT